MADTVKKSRIVSEQDCLSTFADGLSEDTSLQDIINEEFNQRLKNCMRDEASHLEANAEHIALTYEVGEVVLKNGDLNADVNETIPATDLDVVQSNSPVLNSEASLSSAASDSNVNGTISTEDNDQDSSSQNNGLQKQDTVIRNENYQDGKENPDDDILDQELVSDELIELEPSPETENTDSFVNKEIPSPEDEMESPFDNVTVTDVDSEHLTAKERFLSTVTDLDDNVAMKIATVKDRMFLSTDAPCLLFTQTVVQSPMLTPTDENYDFLQALKQQNASETNVATPGNASPVRNEEIIKTLEQEELKKEESQIIIEGNSPEKIEDSIDHIVIDDRVHENGFKPDNLELAYGEDEKVDDFSEISAENEVCNEIESSCSDISEHFQQIEQTQSETANLENISSTDDIKDATIKFIQNEITECDGDITSISNTQIIPDNVESLEKINIMPEIVEDLVDDLTEEDLSQEDIKENQEISIEEDEVVEEISETKNTKSSPSKVSEISKIFSSTEDKDDKKEVVKTPSPILETSENVQRAKEIFERKSTSPENEYTVPKRCGLIKRLSDRSSSSDDIDFDTNKTVCSNKIVSSSTTITSESTFVETRTEMNSNQDKVLKKKKSKKSKKYNEKENISVCDYTNTNDEDSLSHVSVKNLCRSFSDLTSVGNKNGDVKKPKVSYSRAKSMSDIRKDDVKRDSVFSNVSVKFLRQCFDNLTNRTNKCFPRKSSVNHLIKPVVYTSARIEKLKSSFSKFDALQKKTILHVRSSDTGKAQEKFNGNAQIETSACKSCLKPVFQMEQIKAEKSIFHKNCFRCKECNKQLNVDTYQSNDGELYCKPHFKALFAPKAVEDDQPMPRRKHQLIISENQPLELPPDVVRASDKPDLGLDELQNLNVKERFQVFEHHESQDNNVERTGAVNVKRSPSILSKLAKFQSKGMDIGVADDSLNGVPVEESSSEEEEEEEEEGYDGEDADLIRAKRAQREKPLHFTNMSEVMSKWESGNQMTKEERREERKQEIQSIRNRLFMGKQGKMKEMYQQAVAESESGANVKKSVLDTELCEGAKSIKDKFERGEALTSDEQQKLHELEEDRGVFESGISKKSRSIFLELDANASKAPQLTPLSPSKSGTEVRRAREAFMARQASEDTVRETDQVDDVRIKTADISDRFKFFETYKEPAKERKQFRITPPRDGQVKMTSPERDVYRDPDVVRSEEYVDDSQLAVERHTATKMLSIFRQMEENLAKDPAPAGPKPLKCFTPPPEPVRDDVDSEADEEDESDVEDEESDDERANGGNLVDNDLLEAQKAARAKQLRAKFEKWETKEIQREQNNSSVNLAGELTDGESQIESARSLRARFESMRETNADKERAPRVKVNRFVDTTNNVETCKSCEGRVYPLEKVSCHNNVYHKNCFRCRECKTILRMDSYTYNQGLLYCVPHFKRLFISKGNYESGFGLDQHKEKWNNTVA